MKLWKDTTEGSAGSALRATVKGQVAEINRKVLSRGVRAVNAMRSAELQVLRGQRSGRVYRKPGTFGRANKVTRQLKGEFGHKLKGGQLYRASAPGEPPARRTGNLRLHWNGEVKRGAVSGNRMQIIAALESGEKYASLLENGTARMAPRPFVEQIKEKAMPEIKKIYEEPYD